MTGVRIWKHCLWRVYSGARETLKVALAEEERLSPVHGGHQLISAPCPAKAHSSVCWLTQLRYIRLSVARRLRKALIRGHPFRALRQRKEVAVPITVCVGAKGWCMARGPNNADIRAFARPWINHIKGVRTSIDAGNHLLAAPFPMADWRRRKGCQCV